MKIGRGKIRKRDGKIICEGIFSFKEGDEVVVIRKNELKDILENKVEFLLATAEKMPEDWWDYDRAQPAFLSEIVYTAKDGTKHKLIFERKIYSPNFKDMIFIRYVSVDQAFEEEDFD